MGKTTFKLLTFLLVLVMLFSASATTIFAAEGAGTGATASIGEGTSTGAGSTGATTNSGEYDLDWFKIEYSGDNVIITLNPAKITSLDSFTLKDNSIFSLHPRYHISHLVTTQAFN